MAGQEILALAYVLCGLALAITPIAYIILKHGAEIRALIAFIPRHAIALIGALLAAAATYILDGGAFLTGSLVVSLAIAALTPNDRIRTFFLALVAAGASGTLFWWKFDAAHVLTIENQYLAYFFVAVLAISSLTLIRNVRYRSIDVVIVLIILAFILQHSLNFSVLRDNGDYTAIRHHWGAYIGPSETVLSGARLLYDIPAQYGFGPTLAIAAACGDNCWIGMYWITAVASIIYALLVTAAAGVIVRNVDNSWTYAVTLLAAAAACMLWTSYPPQLAGPWSFPSTGGLRFVPLAAMLLFILWSESRPAERRPSRLYGHALWCLGAIWSPEAAFYLSFVWWPYLLWRAGGASARPFRAAAVAALEIAGVVAGLLIVFIAAFHLIYGVNPSLDVYVAYVVNPTGPQPPNPLGSFWFFAFAVAVGVSAAALLIGDKIKGGGFGSLFACVLSLFAVFSYYIGRSHDNNILNIMPFLVLALAAVQSFAPLPSLSRSARVALASTLAAVMFFGWSAWRQTSPADYANTTTVASMAYLRGPSAEQTGEAAIPPFDVGAAEEPSQGQEPAKSRVDGANAGDAARAVFYVSSIRREPLIKIDDGLDMAPIGPRAWSAIHDPIDFYFLPDDLVAKVIDRTMRRIKSPGWLVIAKHVDSVPETLRWQRLLEGSYRKTEEMDFGAYHAIRYEPNPR